MEPVHDLDDSDTEDDDDNFSDWEEDVKMPTYPLFSPELQLESEVELVWTATRQPNDPSLAFNPSGRVSSAAAPTTATAG